MLFDKLVSVLYQNQILLRYEHHNYHEHNLLRNSIQLVLIQLHFHKEHDFLKNNFYKLLHLDMGTIGVLQHINLVNYDFVQINYYESILLTM